MKKGAGEPAPMLLDGNCPAFQAFQEFNSPGRYWIIAGLPHGHGGTGDTQRIGGLGLSFEETAAAVHKWARALGKLGINPAMLSASAGHA